MPGECSSSSSTRVGQQPPPHRAPHIAPLLTHRYCSKEHQQQHYKEHKQSCRAAAPFVDALIESVEEAKPQTYAEIQKLIVGASIFAQRSGPQGHIGHNLFMMLSNTMYCRVCFKLREQLPPGNPLVCCPKCLWGWTCKQHRWVAGGC